MARVTDTKNHRWYAERDFNLKNLSIVTGEVLPKNWQSPGSVRYLKQNYGENCVIWTNRRDSGNGKDQDASELDILKAKMEKMQETVNQLRIELENQKPKEVTSDKRKLKRKASIK